MKIKKYKKLSIIVGFLNLAVLFLILFLFRVGRLPKFKPGNTPMYAVLPDPNDSAELIMIRRWSDPPFQAPGTKNLINIQQHDGDSFLINDGLHPNDLAQYVNQVVAHHSDWKLADDVTVNKIWFDYEKNGQPKSIFVCIVEPLAYTLKYPIQNGIIQKPLVGYTSNTWGLLEIAICLLVLGVDWAFLVIRRR